METWLVDWTTGRRRACSSTIGTVGEVRRAGDAFVAELRGLMDQLDAERGRTYRATCGADLGDARCRVDLADARFATTGTVLAVPEPGRLAVALAGSFRATGGSPAGAWPGPAAPMPDRRPRSATRPARRGRSASSSGRPRRARWRRATRFSLTAGCDKRLATCRERFANVPNFQGFPHMPGNDFVLRSAPGSGPGLDGGSLFR